MGLVGKLMGQVGWSIGIVYLGCRVQVGLWALGLGPKKNKNK